MPPLPYVVTSLLARYGLEEAQASVLQHVTDLVLKVEHSGQSWSLRVLTADHSRVRLDLELRWLAALGRDTALNIPVPMPNLDGQLVTLWTPPNEMQARPCVLSRWVDGERISRQMDGEAARQLGQLTAQLHRHAREHPELWNGYPGQRWDAPRLLGPASWWMRRAELDLGEEYERLRPAVAKLANVFTRLGESPEHFGLIHADLHFGNVLRGASGLGIIDFAEAAPGYYAFDLALTAGELMDYPEGAAYVQAFYEAYRRAAAPETAPLAEVKIFEIATGLAFLTWVYGLPEGETRQDKLRWVPGLLEAMENLGRPDAG